MKHESNIIADLRQRVGAIEGLRPPSANDRFAIGHAGLDARLGGGLLRGRLHELFAAEPDDAASAAGFALMLAARASAHGPIIWLREDRAERRLGRLHGAGFAELGIDPWRVIMVTVPDEIALLRAAGDAVRCPEVGMLLVEPWKAARALDLTASRRLAVAAEASGVTSLLLRVEADPGPSAAQTRWQVRSAASTALEADAPGHPAIEVDLLRQRGGPAGFHHRLEWDRETLSFRDPALSGLMVPLPADGSPAAGRLSA
jgi:protein ImuA